MEEKKNKYLKSNISNAGITLIALVITIVILIILAGVTISLTLGNNGLFNKAKEAKEKYQNATVYEEEQIAGIEGKFEELTGENKTPSISEVSTIKEAKQINATSVETGIITLKDDNNNDIKIPCKFHIASDSATKREDGIVIEDNSGNQFVWIPVDNISDYIRRNFGQNDGSAGYSAYSETLPTDEQTSVTNNKGYYIGRYEAGDKESTANKTMRTSSSSATNTLTIKKGQAPYDYLTIDQVKNLAEGMSTKQGYTAKTKLCSSYAWDTAINFIKNKVSNYDTSSQQGNYYNTTFSYIDITGASQTKSINTETMVPTGQTTPVCNIYDMGGNAYDFTSELCSANSSEPYVLRSGNYKNAKYGDYTQYAAGSRCYTDNVAREGMVPRVTLFL